LIIKGDFTEYFIANGEKMSETPKDILENIIVQDMDEAWAELANRRYVDLITGKVKGVTWDEIKKEIQGGFEIAKINVFSCGK
jgi:hypothetical protein